MYRNKKLKVLSGFVQHFLKAAGIIFLLILSFSYTKKEAIREVYEEHYSLPQKIKAVPLKNEYTFAGEKIPMSNFDLKERMDREFIVNTYRHSATIQYIKLANRYFPTIEAILKKNNIPDDFKYLAIAESGLRNVSSPAGAKGLWQFMKPIAREMDLEIYKEVDERYHVEKSTQAACDYLNRLKNRFGSWINAAAAYNVGPSSFSRSLRDQNEGHYFDLNINEETMRYLFRIVAIKSIISNPEDYGFNIAEAEKYAPLDNYYIVQVDSTINNLGAFAQKHGTSYRMLKIYNPWLRDYKLTVKKNRYLLKIPKT